MASEHDRVWGHAADLNYEPATSPELLRESDQFQVRADRRLFAHESDVKTGRKPGEGVSVVADQLKGSTRRIMETMFAWVHNYEYPAIVLLLMLGIVGLPIPDETLLLFVGYLSFKGELSTPLSLSAAVVGSAGGITISYGLGHLLGARVPTTLGPWLHIDHTRFLTAQRWVSQWGKYGLLIAYFVPGLRHLGALTLGASGLHYPTFAMFAYTGAVVWSTTFITAGYLLGEEWVTSSATLHQTFRWIGIGAVMTVVGLIVLMMLRRSSSRS